MDFQIPADDQSPSPGSVHNLTEDLAAIVTPGLELAFDDIRRITLDHTSPKGDKITREIQVCGPASLLILKGLAIKERDKLKDYYDIFYILHNWSGGVEKIAERTNDLQQFDDQGHIPASIENLERDFQDMEHVGPRSVARFLFGEDFDKNPEQEQDQLLRQSQLLVERFWKSVKSSL